MIDYVNLGISEEEYEEEISPRLKELFLSGQFVYAKQVEEFEANFAKYCGSKYAIALNSGTDALIFALKSLGIGQGDEVITVSNSFIATANAIEYVGATPIFVDINDNLLMDSLKLRAVITKKTKAIIPVHLMGLVCEMDEINSIAKEYNIDIIEDAAQSVGSVYKGKKTGTFGKIGCFSLHPTKNLSGITDGGIVTTDDKDISIYLKQVRNHGLIDRDRQNIIGRVSRLNSLNAVVLSYRLTILDSLLGKRIKTANLYSQLLKSIKEVKLIDVPSDVYHTYHTYIIKVTNRDKLQQYLLEHGIEAKIHYPILIHQQKPYKDKYYNLKNTEKLSLNILTLPISNITTKEVEYICNTINNFYKISI
ncbi:MAG: DegT/DnrJ/EryC1/StrS family aminotransferase [Arcobacteraceae bacterium]|nr:DegT/DnrJ/EryC1/StrS family aminotransferase [Arcobacteraceae bacterium]